jgi:hypothetical protein
MAVPKGVRAIAFPVSSESAVHVYSDASCVWLQLRRDVATETAIGEPSFKVALELTPDQAIAIAGELLTAGTRHKSGRKTVEPRSAPKPHQPGSKS